jgi:PAS domain S-box-containing protein
MFLLLSIVIRLLAMEQVKKISDALFNNVSMGIIIVNSFGEIHLVNQFLLKQFGYTEPEVTGKKIEILIPRRYKDKHEHHRENYIANAHSRPMGLGMDLHGVKKDGTEFPVEISLSSYTIDEQRYTIAFVNDITIRKRSEEELIKLNAELERKVAERTQSLSETVEQLEDQIKEAQEKDIQLREALEKEKDLNELKSRFVSLASHEFRTPLSTVLSSVYLVQKYQTTEDQPKREKHIQRIVASVNTLTDILNDFLSVGKIEEGKTQVRSQAVEIKDAINAIIAEMQPILKKGQKISYFHTGANSVYLDPALLKHIVINLVSNAIKFSPENSPIKIFTNNNEHRLELSVLDSGMGISKDDQEHLFERFFRGTNVTNIQGTGLGLHIVGKYAELMNGTIECKSELERGTEFIISLAKKEINENNSSN